MARADGRYLPIHPLPVGTGGSVSADRGTDPPLWGPFHTTIYNREPWVRRQAWSGSCRPAAEGEAAGPAVEGL
ncbi:hypothetical protein Psuf_080680 [Phytohabitans suffuscus]|uniref:Uncharacterized protein n=1 Tax=Phytohabitans suffuscus TaxID=624315 RepID=A0A6F8YX55_9ACTN|nr:hypothetical protein Psuf_080680 [Phytohabitans suffuscus]